jgi:hypothetical protein
MTWYAVNTKSARIAQDEISREYGLPTRHSVNAVVSLEISAFRIPFCV